MHTLSKALLAAVVMLPLLAAHAQSYPDRPVRMVVPAAVGGTTDKLARAVADRLAGVWGQPVVVDNRPGGGQIIGAEAVARAEPDGYTLLVTDSSTLVINPHLHANLPYDAQRDFTPIAIIGNASPVIAINPAVEAQDIKGLLALAKAKPGTLSYGSMGPGSYAHIALERFKQMSGADILHVPYKGAAPAITDLLAGHISLMLVNVAGLLPHEKAGKLRIIAAATPQRLAKYPDLPTVAESGVPGFEANTWFGIVGPAKLDPAVVQKINRDVNAIARDPAFQQQVLDINSIEGASLSPDEFRKLIQTDLEMWKDVVKAAGVKAS